MGKDHTEKEKILRGFWGDNESNPFVLDIDDFFLLKENGILDAKVMLRLQSEVEALVGSGCFALIDGGRGKCFCYGKRWNTNNCPLCRHT